MRLPEMFASILRIYSIDFNEPFLHISSFQDTVSVSLCCPVTWSISLRESCDLWIAVEEICLAVEELGWRRRARLPHPVDVDSPKNFSKWRKRGKILEIQLSTKWRSSHQLVDWRGLAIAEVVDLQQLDMPKGQHGVLVDALLCSVLWNFYSYLILCYIFSPSRVPLCSEQCLYLQASLKYTFAYIYPDPYESDLTVLGDH